MGSSKGKLPTGIVRTATGWRTFVRIHPGRGGLPSKVWPRETTLQRMKAWREEQRVRARLGAELPEATSTFREDVRAYLQRIQTMITLADRRRDLQRWIDALGGGRSRQSITAGEVHRQLETWRKAGSAANTCNHRRTALMHLFTTLDGKSAKNPIKDVPKYRDESQDAPPRALHAASVALLLDAMPESLTKRRLELMAWTGWPPAQIAKIAAADIQWNVAVRLQPRRKGKGAAGVWLPLLPEAWAALEAFKKAGAWGAYTRGSVRKSFRLAAGKVRERIMLPMPMWQELGDVTPYQLRHSFLTMVAAASKDDRAVQTLGQHSNLATSHRYTSATADPRALAALTLVTSRLHSTKESPQTDDSKDR